jgi:heterodisulfide reductase subunit B
MKYLYYPGCSQKATSRACDEALTAVAPKLGIELEELDDWNCCGATAVPAVSKLLALSLSARNLALAESRGKGQPVDLMTPCPNCWMSLAKAHEVLTGSSPEAAKVRSALAEGGYSYEGRVKVRHLLDVLVNDVGMERLKGAATKALAGLKVAPYYGCQVVRPKPAGGDDPYDPQNLEKLIEALGGTVAAFPMKTACCGGALVATRDELGRKMSWSILQSIDEAGADLIVTPCSMCQVTMEVVQVRGTGRPAGMRDRATINLAQLLALALGVSEERAGLQRSLIPVHTVRHDDLRSHA